MATTDLTTITEDEARMRAFQIIGSDIPPGTAAYTGEWHQALQKTADRWAQQIGATKQADTAATTTTNPAPAA